MTELYSVSNPRRFSLVFMLQNTLIKFTFGPIELILNYSFRRKKKPDHLSFATSRENLTLTIKDLMTHMGSWKYLNVIFLKPLA